MKPSKMKPGTLFYECQSGINIEAVCIEAPIQSAGHEDRPHWTWPARNTQTGELISYGLTEGLEHYGPRLYGEPQYCSIRDKKFLFDLLGGAPEGFDPDAGDPAGQRFPEHLLAWAGSLGADGPAIPVDNWIKMALEVSGKTMADRAFTVMLPDIANQVTDLLRSEYEKKVLPTFSHAVDFAAEVISADAGGEDITPAMIRQALRSRLDALSDQDLMQAVNVFDSAEVEKAMPEAADDDPEMEI